MVDISKMNEKLEKALEAAQAVTTDPVKKAVNLRLSNPFFLCFMSSWVICNWDRILLLLFSFTLGIEQRIEKVKSLPSNSVFWGLSIPHTHTFWYPFIASLIFVVGHPFVSFVVDFAQRKVIAKNNTNDSQKKLDALDLKIKEINKNVEYEYADAKARLNAENASNAIEYSTASLKEKYTDLETKVRDLNISIKEKEEAFQAQSRSYSQMSNSLLEIRDELDLKGKELLDLNSKIISNQNKLDSINQEISKKTLPFLTGSLSGLGSLGGVNLAGTLLTGNELGKLNLGGQMLDKAASDPKSIKTLKDLATDHINKSDNK